MRVGDAETSSQHGASRARTGIATVVGEILQGKLVKMILKPTGCIASDRFAAATKDLAFALAGLGLASPFSALDLREAASLGAAKEARIPLETLGACLLSAIISATFSSTSGSQRIERRL